MPTQPPTRSVKISEDERGGWSSDRPRRDGAPPRPASVSVRCRVLSPSDQVRYSPGSLLVIVSASSAERDRFAQRLIDNRATLLSLDKVRALLAGRATEEEIGARAVEVLETAVLKRLEANSEERARLERRLAEPTLWDAFTAIVERQGSPSLEEVLRHTVPGTDHDRTLVLMRTLPKK